MSDLLTARQVVWQLKFNDSVQKIEAIRAARIYMCMPYSEEGKAQLETLNREERLSAARLPRDVFHCMYSEVEEVAQEAAFVLVAASKSYHQCYQQQRFVDLPASQVDSLIEHLEAFLSSFKVDVVVESQLLYKSEDEKHYFATATFKILNCMPYRIGGRKVRLNGLQKQEENDFVIISQYPHAALIDSNVVEPSVDEKESGVQYKGVGNLSIVKELYDSEEDGIRVHMVFNGIRSGSYMKIEGLPEKVPV
jgi:hypothetical protein